MSFCSSLQYADSIKVLFHPPTSLSFIIILIILILFPALLRYNCHRTLYNFKVYNIMIWYTFYKMVTEISLVNTSITSHSYNFFLWWDQFKIYSNLSKFQIYDIVLLTIVILLYIISLELIYIITGNLYLLTIFTHFPTSCPPPHLETNNLFSVPMSLFSFFRFPI